MAQGTENDRKDPGAESFKDEIADIDSSLDKLNTQIGPKVFKID